MGNGDHGEAIPDVQQHAVAGNKQEHEHARALLLLKVETLVWDPRPNILVAALMHVQVKKLVFICVLSLGTLSTRLKMKQIRNLYNFL